MVPVSRFVDLLLSQEGDRYIFGAEVKLSDSDPSAFDCSELVEWAAYQVGVQPRVPDGSWYQARHCRNHGKLISVDTAIKTRGALLFKFSSSPFEGGRPSSAHVAVSLGDGRTIEARGSKWGVGVFSAHGRGWTHAGLVPGIEYGGAAPAPVRGDDEMQLIKNIQTMLNKAGARDYEGKVLVVDGEWGPRTESAFINGLKLGGGTSTVDAEARNGLALTDEQLEALDWLVKQLNQSEVSSWAKPSWDKAVDVGVIRHNNPPGEPVSVERMVTFLDRAGALDQMGVDLDALAQEVANIIIRRLAD